MTWFEALEFMIVQTSHERYRWLCSNDNPDAETRDGYRSLMVRKATGQPEPAAPPAAAAAPVSRAVTVPALPPDPWLPLIRACEDYNPACCSNPAPWCSRFEIVPTRDQCIDCLTERGITPQ